MVDRIKPNRFKNKNLLSIKDVAKKTAAVTLLLSTTACNLSDIPTPVAWIMVAGGVIGLGLLLSGGGRGKSGGSSSGSTHADSWNYRGSNEGNDPDRNIKW